MATATSSFDLDDALRRKGMTGRRLARSLNIEEATISRYRRGLQMTPGHEARIREALGAREGES